MIQMTIEMPESALSALRKNPEDFAKELRLAAAVKWYELRRVSQGRAAEIAGLTRTEFISALGQLGVSAIQATPEDLEREIAGG